MLINFSYSNFTFLSFPPGSHILLESILTDILAKFLAVYVSQTLQHHKLFHFCLELVLTYSLSVFFHESLTLNNH